MMDSLQAFLWFAARAGIVWMLAVTAICLLLRTGREQ